MKSSKENLRMIFYFANELIMLSADPSNGYWMRPKAFSNALECRLYAKQELQKLGIDISGERDWLATYEEFN